MSHPPLSHRLRYAARTHPGLVRANNEDSYFASDRLLIVADGMGGHAAGEVASKLVVDSVARLVEEDGAPEATAEPQTAAPETPAPETTEPEPAGETPRETAEPETAEPEPAALEPAEPEPAPTTAPHPRPADPAGETPRETAVETPRDPAHDLAAAVRAGNRAIAEFTTVHPQLAGMGTTVSALFFDGGRAAIVHVGDSRIYLYRDDVLHQLTHDDTFVQSLVDEGRITERQAHDHPQRNLVLRALTGQPVEPMVATRDLKTGDRFLLCSDGLCGVVDAETIAEALAHPDPAVATDTLVQLALAAGGPDNVTVIVADVTAATGSPAPPPASDDPAATNPILRLTREMPRVPLPPIPEEPGAAREEIDEEIYDDPRDDSDPDEVEDDPDDESAPGFGRKSRAPRSRRAKWLLRIGATLALIVVLAGVITGVTLWARTQYYVAEQGNVVVIFRGVDGSVLGWRLSTFEETSCAGKIDCAPMKVSDLQPAFQNRVRSGIKATSLDGAREIVKRLEDQLLPPCPPLAQDRGADAAAPPSAAPPSAAPPSAAPPSAAPPSTGTASEDDTVPRASTPAVAIPGVTCRTVS